jgi:hypothetical protein
MAVNYTDFDKVWASASPLTPYEFSDNNYRQGWNFVGGTPPSRQMWDFLQKNNDEKMKYLADNYLPLSGGTLTGDVNGVTPPAGDNSKKIANTEFIQALANILVPTGCVQAFAGQTTPDGWLLCDGSAVSRVTYAKLFSVIGTSYGSGDGSTTFNVPNLIDRFVQGNATAGTVKSAGLPNITGGLSSTGGYALLWKPVSNVDASGSFRTYTDGNKGVYPGDTVNYDGTGITFDASRRSSIYGASNTVQPPALTMQYIIKY